ncbi:hypothetical protein AB0D56_37895 [Streptomyces sp. NPDC048209]|uniref:hypothetical protein n=1 Tax=Streptomyces sp. NPDC048209 TaxID=3156689 RepID=UPI003436723B
MGIDRHEEHVEDVGARPVVGGVLLVFTATKPQNTCTDRTPWLREAPVFLPRQHAAAIRSALAADDDYHHQADGVRIDVTGPPDEDMTGWFIVEHGTDRIEVDLTARSLRQLSHALAEALDAPPLHPFIRMYEHADLHDSKGRYH